MNAMPWHQLDQQIAASAKIWRELDAVAGRQLILDLGEPPSLVRSWEMKHGQKWSSFYNTTGETGAELKAKERKASKQEQTILKFMQRHKMQPFTREQIEQQFSMKTQSASRAMANLTKLGAIRKSEKARWTSSEGVRVHAWRVE